MARVGVQIGKVTSGVLQDAALIDVLLQAEPDVLDLNRALEARLDAERADAAAIEALLQAETDVLDLNWAVLLSVQSARMLRLNE